MKWPTTIRKTLLTLSALVAIVATVGGGAWKFHQSNAYAADVQAVEMETVAAIKALRCEIIDEQIRQLELKRAEGQLKSRERAWLRNLLRQWNKHCTGDGA